jgi:hypothetical protein
MQTSIFVKQRTDAPAKVQSGTFATVYVISNDNPTAMSLQPILERASVAPGLDWDLHICPTTTQLTSTLFQFKVHIIRILTTYLPSFGSYADKPALQHKPRHLLPLMKTKVYPL